MDGFKGIKLDEEVVKEQPGETGGEPVLRGLNGEKKFGFPKIGILRRKIVLFAFGLFLLIFIAIGIPGFMVYSSAKKASRQGQEFLAATRSQNLEEMKVSLDRTRENLISFENRLKILSWTRIIPFFGGYVSDAQHGVKAAIIGTETGDIVIQALEPYADFLGFKGSVAANSPTKTAEERINFLVQTIEGITPRLDEISEKMAVITAEVNHIDPNRYPQSLRGKPVKEKVREAVTLVNQINELVSHGRPVLEKAPYLLGKDGERQYLFIWQNDKELRPTGGFITAYSIVKVKDGKFQPVASNDIYNLDDKLRNKEPAPEPIKKYLPLVTKWNLRDMNLSPDFKESMQVFVENYRKTKSPEFDGLIAMDSHLLVNVLNVLGSIGVPGYGNYSTEVDSRCNCPQVIYELESFADVAGPIVWDPVSGKIVYKPPHADNRKEVLGPLMNSILANAMGQPKEKLPDLFQAGWNSVLEKHVLFYFEREDVQKAMEAFNLAGRIRDFEGDYLHINDTNFAGAKSNLYVQQEVKLDVEPGKDGNTNTLTVKYKNPQKYDGWLNGPYRDWVRVYVPKGSALIDSTGSEVGFETKEDLGKTMFEGFFVLRPEGVQEIKLTYKTPVKKDGLYKLLIQKQPGTDGHHYTVAVSDEIQEFNLKTDKELSF